MLDVKELLLCELLKENQQMMTQNISLFRKCFFHKTLYQNNMNFIKNLA